MSAACILWAIGSAALALDRNETVILLHGIAKSSAHMTPLERALTREGYTVLNVDYPSTTQTLEELTTTVQAEINQRLNPSDTVHFVGYSMGGLLTRLILAENRPTHLGYVVTLGTPHQGSEVSDTLRDVPLYQWIFGPAGQQLVTDDTGIHNRLPPVNYPLGAIAGDKSIDPISSAIIPGEDDGKVSITSALPKDAVATVILPVHHLNFPNDDTVHAYVIRFLETGTFAD